MGKIDVCKLKVIKKIDITNSTKNSYNEINNVFYVVEVAPNLSPSEISQLPPLFSGSIVSCDTFIKLLKSGTLIL